MTVRSANTARFAASSAARASFDGLIPSADLTTDS